MNISGGASFATPFWQTEDLRLGVVSASHADDLTLLSVLLSCGMRITAHCPADLPAAAGSAVQVERRAGRWHIRRRLE